MKSATWLYGCISAIIVIIGFCGFSYSFAVQYPLIWAAGTVLMLVISTSIYVSYIKKISKKNNK
jgi:hypothetical protein